MFTLFHIALFFAFGACQVVASDLQLGTPTLTQVRILPGPDFAS